MHFYCNKEENVHRFALSTLIGKLLERDRERQQQIINEIKINTCKPLKEVKQAN